MIKTSVNLDELLDVYSEPNSKVTLTAVTMTASQKIPATERSEVVTWAQAQARIL